VIECGAKSGDRKKRQREEWIGRQRPVRVNKNSKRIEGGGKRTVSNGSIAGQTGAVVRGNELVVIDWRVNQGQTNDDLN
jgi:hypothetical protein